MKRQQPQKLIAVILCSFTFFAGYSQADETKTHALDKGAKSPSTATASPEVSPKKAKESEPKISPTKALEANLSEPEKRVTWEAVFKKITKKDSENRLDFDLPYIIPIQTPLSLRCNVQFYCTAEDLPAWEKIQEGEMVRLTCEWNGIVARNVLCLIEPM